VEIPAPGGCGRARPCRTRPPQQGEPVVCRARSTWVATASGYCPGPDTVVGAVRSPPERPRTWCPRPPSRSGGDQPDRCMSHGAQLPLRSNAFRRRNSSSSISPRANRSARIRSASLSASPGRGRDDRPVVARRSRPRILRDPRIKVHLLTEVRELIGERGVLEGVVVEEIDNGSRLPLPACEIGCSPGPTRAQHGSPGRSPSTQAATCGPAPTPFPRTASAPRARVTARAAGDQRPRRPRGRRCAQRIGQAVDLRGR
jgi:hypothetical protein